MNYNLYYLVPYVLLAKGLSTHVMDKDPPPDLHHVTSKCQSYAAVD